ncbi:MAG: Fur family transcriptional regulator [Bacteroidia bacterium]
MTTSAKPADSAQRLRQHGVRSTPFRRALLLVLGESSVALTQAQISQRLGHDTDRVTLYRNLRSLMQAGILHEINAGTTNPCYALCPPVCDATEHQHRHIHFLCDSCGTTHCVDSSEPPWPVLPTGYLVRDWKLTAEGLCTTCSKSQK